MRAIYSRHVRTDGHVNADIRGRLEMETDGHEARIPQYCGGGSRTELIYKTKNNQFPILPNSHHQGPSLATLILSEVYISHHGSPQNPQRLDL